MQENIPGSEDFLMVVEKGGEFIQAVMVISGHDAFRSRGLSAFSCWAECFGSRLWRKQSVSETCKKRGKDMAQQVPDAQVTSAHCTLIPALPFPAEMHLEGKTANGLGIKCSESNIVN